MVYAALLVVPLFIGFCLIRKFREHQWGVCKSNSSLSGKIYLVTGANSGIGKEVVKCLAARDATIVMACRDLTRAKAALADIRKNVKTGTLIIMRLDLASLDSVRIFAEKIVRSFPRVHCLINNAGVYYPTSSSDKTAEGHEMNFGVNHLGHFLLTNILLKRLRESAPSRIVIVTSGLHEKGSIDVEDLNLERRKMESKLNAKAAYCASKLANIYYARELGDRLRGSGITVYAACPGFTYSNLFRRQTMRWWQYIAFFPVAYFFMRTTWQGAQTVVHCATAENIEHMSGEFFRNCKLSKSNFKFDAEIQKQLYKKCEDLTRAAYLSLRP